MGIARDSLHERTTKPLSEINVTPFVDVMLVLLVIFMVTAPLLEQGISVELPRSVAGKLVEQEKQMTLTLTKDRQIFLDKQKITLEGLDVRLQKLARENPKTSIFLRADRGLPYGYVIRVVGKIRESGLSDLGLVTELEENR